MGDDIDALKQRHLKQLQRKIDEIRALQRQWRNEMKDFYAREQKLRRNEKQLQADNEHLSRALLEHQISKKDPQTIRNYTQNREIWKLNSEIHEMRKVASFAKLTPPTPCRLDTKCIDTAMADIEFQLKPILLGNNTQGPFLIPSEIKVSVLGSLIRAVEYTCAENEAMPEDVRLGRWCSKFEKQTVVRVLALAALKEWVFETDFPNFMPLDSDLLRSTWEVVLAHGKKHYLSIMVPKLANTVQMDGTVFTI